eukprot:10376347-Alexandrium_andersonii.AAC.1
MGRSYPVDRFGGRWGARRARGRKEPFRKRPAEIATEVWEALSRTEQHEWWEAKKSAVPAPCAVAESSRRI